MTKSKCGNSFLCHAFFSCYQLRDWSIFEPHSLLSFYDKKLHISIVSSFCRKKTEDGLFKALLFFSYFNPKYTHSLNTLSLSLSLTHAHTHNCIHALARSTHTWWTFLYVWKRQQHTFFWDFEDVKLLWQPSRPHALYHISWCKFEVRYCLTVERPCSLNLSWNILDWNHVNKL